MLQIRGQYVLGLDKGHFDLRRMLFPELKMMTVVNSVLLYENINQEDYTIYEFTNYSFSVLTMPHIGFQALGNIIIIILVIFANFLKAFCFNE